jgi:hypothetical protein
VARRAYAHEVTDEHERYEELAVGHVLGGLDVADAAEFRTHLVACRDCRLRVAELRDIAADLAAAERDERSQAQVRTEVARRAEDDAVPDTRGVGRIGPRQVSAAALVVLVIAVGVGFWNLHLRTSVAEYRRVADHRGQTLDVLATGASVPTSFTGRVGGTVVRDDERVAFNLSGLPATEVGQRIVVWLLGTAEGAEARLIVPGPQLQSGTLAGTIEIDGATELVVSQELPGLGAGPEGEVLVRADLEAVSGGAGSTDGGTTGDGSTEP